MHYSGSFLYELLTEQERKDLHWYLEEYGLWPFYEFAERGKRIEALLVEVGEKAVQGSVWSSLCRQENRASVAFVS